MNVQEALDKTYTQLETASIPDCRLDAEYLVAEAVGIPRLSLVLEKAKVLSETANRQLSKWTTQRLARRPLAYVLGEQPFFDLTLRVGPAVLVPRPETELLVEQALRFLDTRERAVAVDVGTGSGNIALSLARHPNVAAVHAIDISAEALALAQENAERNRSPKVLEWHLGDLLHPIVERGIAADLIVANLPYIKTGDLPGLSPEVHCEPVLALDGGADGLSLIQNVIHQAENVLRTNGVLLLEIGADQGDDVLMALIGLGPWTDVCLLRDLAHLPRIVRAMKGGPVGSIND